MTALGGASRDIRGRAVDRRVLLVVRGGCVEPEVAGGLDVLAVVVVAVGGEGG